MIGWLGERGLQQRRRHQRRQHDHGDDRRERGVAEDGRPGDEDRVADAGEDQTDLTVRNHADANRRGCSDGGGGYVGSGGGGCTSVRICMRSPDV